MRPTRKNAHLALDHARLGVVSDLARQLWCNAWATIGGSHGESFAGRDLYTIAPDTPLGVTEQVIGELGAAHIAFIDAGLARGATSSALSSVLLGCYGWGTRGFDLDPETETAADELPDIDVTGGGATWVAMNAAEKWWARMAPAAL